MAAACDATAPRRLLLAVGGDLLGQWLPVCIALALPETQCRFIGQLWTSGNFVRGAGLPYRCWPWTLPAAPGPSTLPNLTDFHLRGLRPDALPEPVRRAYGALQALAEREFDDFQPDAVLSLTAESALGHILDTLARPRGILSVGLQTTFLRQALLVHPYGADWWRALRDAELPATGCGTAAPLPNHPPPAVRPPSRLDGLRRRRMVWAARAERLLRSAVGAPSFDELGSLLALLGRSTQLRPGGFADLGTADIGAEPPVGMVLVALHRPALPPGEPDWIDLLRFALAATPLDMPLVIRPHPDEPQRPLPDDLALALRQRGARVSRPGQGAGLAVLLRHTRALLTLSSSAGMQALQAGVPTLVIGPAFYARPGLAWQADRQQPAQLRAWLSLGRLPAPDPAAVHAFAGWIEHALSAPLPALSTEVVPAEALARKIRAMAACPAAARAMRLTNRSCP